ncbi:MAG: hypothetical protein HQK49_17135 [Oligoflexia bacterium]|nr:hypothetical protein [Oligoflexia bacterium]
MSQAQYTDELRLLFHHLISANSSFGSGVDVVRRKIMNKEDYEVFMPLLDKKVMEMQNTYNMIKAKIDNNE